MTDILPKVDCRYCKTDNCPILRTPDFLFYFTYDWELKSIKCRPPKFAVLSFLKKKEPSASDRMAIDIMRQHLLEEEAKDDDFDINDAVDVYYNNTKPRQVKKYWID